MADELATSVSEWLDMMADTVTITPWTSQDVTGKPVYGGTPVTYPAYVEMKNHLIVDAQGREILAKGRVILGTTAVISVKDKITLPSDYVPQSPPILAVNLQPDEHGTHHVTIEIG